jgi:hypothetical protein
MSGVLRTKSKDSVVRLNVCLQLIAVSTVRARQGYHPKYPLWHPLAVPVGLGVPERDGGRKFDLLPEPTY